MRKVIPTTRKIEFESCKQLKTRYDSELSKKEKERNNSSERDFSKHFKVIHLTGMRVQKHFEKHIFLSSRLISISLHFPFIFSLLFHLLFHFLSFLSLLLSCLVLSSSLSSCLVSPLPSSFSLSLSLSTFSLSVFFLCPSLCLIVMLCACGVCGRGRGVFGVCVRFGVAR